MRDAAPPPAIYHPFEKVRPEAPGCIPVASGGAGCPDHPGSRYYNTRVEVWYECREHTQAYPDNLASAQIFVNLTQASRQWILTELAQAYPDAHLINPDFTFTFGSGGSSWSMVIPRLQTTDPGDYAVTVAVRTTGTPVSGPRSARLGVGQFNVELVRVRLIEAP